MNRNGPFADRRSYPFDVARPNITDGEDTGQIRFQHLGNVARPLPQRFSHRIEIPACDDESFMVERDATSEPLGSRGCSGHDEAQAGNAAQGQSHDGGAGVGEARAQAPAAGALHGQQRSGL